MNDDVPRRLPARRGFFIRYKGKTLLSTIDPIEQAQRIVQTARIFNRTLYVCLSPLLGYGLSSLVERSTEDSAVLALETDPLLMALSEGEISKALREHPKFRLFCTRSPGELCAFVRKVWGSRRFRRLEVVQIGAGAQFDQGLYENLIAALERDLAIDWANAMTLTKLGRRYSRNMVYNFPLLLEAPFSKAFSDSDRPLLVLGAGPSLDEALEGLGQKLPLSGSKKNRGFSILCVDTALGALVSRGIEPDGVVALEAQQWNLRDFLGTWTGEFQLWMDLSALPATARAVRGPVSFFFTEWTPLAIFDRLRRDQFLQTELPPLGSVGLSAVALGLRTTNAPLVLAGLDFSYLPGRYHARGSPSHTEALLRAHRFSSPLDPGGAYRSRVVKTAGKEQEVYTDPVLRGYRDLFEREFGSSSRVYDMGNFGLPLGIPRLTVEEAADILQSRGAWPRGTWPRGPGSQETGKKADPRGGFPGVNGRDDEGFNTKEKLKGDLQKFLKDEQARLIHLRELLSGETGETIAEPALRRLILEVDYIWAHFPEYAAADRSASLVLEPSFLKRFRAELDPFIKYYRIALQELEDRYPTRPWS